MFYYTFTIQNLSTIHPKILVIELILVFSVKMLL